MEEALAPVGVAGFLLNIAVVDQLAQYPRQALLGNLEDVEQVGNRHAGAQIDEIEDPVMGPAKALSLEERVGIASEIAVGEEEQSHDVEGQILVVTAREIYVSHVDIVLVRCHCFPIGPSLSLIPQPLWFAKALGVGHDRRKSGDRVTAPQYSAGVDDGRRADGPA